VVWGVERGLFYIAVECRGSAPCPKTVIEYGYDVERDGGLPTVSNAAKTTPSDEYLCTTADQARQPFVAATPQRLRHDRQCVERIRDFACNRERGL